MSKWYKKCYNICLSVLNEIKMLVSFVTRELAAAELLSLKLKHQGAMVCRQMSFDGVEINSEKVTLSEGEQAAYEKLYSKYSKMVQNFK